jgi:hypothetical protein
LSEVLLTYATQFSGSFPQRHGAYTHESQIVNISVSVIVSPPVLIFQVCVQITHEPGAKVDAVFHLPAVLAVKAVQPVVALLFAKLAHAVAIIKRARF